MNHRKRVAVVVRLGLALVAALMLALVASAQAPERRVEPLREVQYPQAIPSWASR